LQSAAEYHQMKRIHGVLGLLAVIAFAGVAVAILIGGGIVTSRSPRRRAITLACTRVISSGCG
jgi:hypothetical protein